MAKKIVHAAKPNGKRRTLALVPTPVTDEAEVIVETRTERRMVAARPEYVSQRTSLAVFGLDPRGFLDCLPGFKVAGYPVVHLGKRRLVKADQFSAWLLSQTAPVKEDAANDVDDDQDEDDVARELRALGLVAVGGGR